MPYLITRILSLYLESRATPGITARYHYCAFGFCYRRVTFVTNVSGRLLWPKFCVVFH
jgi:hypothetical protein